MRLASDFEARAALQPAPLVAAIPRRVGKLGGIAGIVRRMRGNMLDLFSEADFARPHWRGRILARRMVLLNTPDLVREAMQGAHAAVERKTPQMRHALEPLLGDGLFVSDGAVWKERRAVVSPVVHASRLDRFAPIMCEVAQDWAASWRARGEGARIDALAEMGELAAEIISRTVFGRQLGREFTSEVVSGFAAYQRHIDQVDLPALLGLPEWTPRWRGRRVRRALARVHRVIDDVLGRHEAARGSGQADDDAVIGALFEARDAQGQPWSREAIRNEAIVLFMAGHETTANTLAWAWRLLADCPRSRARLAAELDSVLGARAPGPDDIRRLPFTRAVIEETLRLYPPVPFLGREAVRAARIGDLEIARGDLVVVAPWLLHRNPKVWSAPDAFIPERFLGDLAPRPSKYAYLPFAVGPRVCPGLAFGLAESVVALATLARDFTLDLPEQGAPLPRCRLTLRPDGGLPMILRRRGDAG